MPLSLVKLEMRRRWWSSFFVVAAQTMSLSCVPKKHFRTFFAFTDIPVFLSLSLVCVCYHYLSTVYVCCSVDTILDFWCNKMRWGCGGFSLFLSSDLFLFAQQVWHGSLTAFFHLSLERLYDLVYSSSHFFSRFCSVISSQEKPGETMVSAKMDKNPWLELH